MTTVIEEKDSNLTNVTLKETKRGNNDKVLKFINKRHVPTILVVLAASLTIYLLLWGWVKIVSFTMTHYRGEEVFYLPFLFGKSESVSFLWIALFLVISIPTWLLSTRVKFFRKPFMRIIMFLLPLIGAVGLLGAYGMSQMRIYVLPYFVERIQNVMALDGNLENIIYAHSHGFLFTLVMIPMLVILFICSFLLTKYQMFDKELKEAFMQFEWKGNWLRRLSDLEKTVHYPDVELGPNVKTGEIVVLPGFDRTLGTAIIGAIGSGKTAALAMPILNQDLTHMTRYINKFPDLIKQDNYESKEVSGREFSGISIIEPSNDLCQKVLKLAKAHGIPDEAITYIDPTNPETPSLNAMRGPVDKVAEVFAQVIAGLNDSKQGGNFFFEQAQRIHLKQFIYLLKLHDPEKDVIFDDLIDMYNDTQLVRRMYEQFVDRIPKNIDTIEGRDERNDWKIVQGVKEWFDVTIVPQVDSKGITMRDPITDELLYEDAKAQYVQGLRNILNDIGANTLIRRVLFGKSDFDFDQHMAMGGLLLVNTAKGELENLGRVLGKIVLMNLQNATFRRKPDVSTYHHILVDEAPEYLYNSFASFPTQSRKYKVIITTLQQTIAQMADAFGEHYMTTILAALRNRMVYGDVPTYDAKYFSEMFGEKMVYAEGMSEQSVSPLQEDPMSRSGSSYQKVREQSMTTGEIMYQEAFYCAVKIVVNNKPMPVQQIKANFVPDEEFEVAHEVVHDEAADIWLDVRKSYRRGEMIGQEQQLIESIEELENKNKESYEIDKEAAVSLSDVPPMEPTYSNEDLHPRGELNYISPPRQTFINTDYKSDVEPPRQTFINTDYVSKAKSIIPERPTKTKLESEGNPEMNVQGNGEIENQKASIIPPPTKKQELEPVKENTTSGDGEPQGKGSIIPAKPIVKNGYNESVPGAEEENLVDVLTKLNGVGEKR